MSPIDRAARKLIQILYVEFSRKFGKHLIFWPRVAPPNDVENSATQVAQVEKLIHPRVKHS